MYSVQWSFEEKQVKSGGTDCRRFTVARHSAEQQRSVGLSYPSARRQYIFICRGLGRGTLPGKFGYI